VAGGMGPYPAAGADRAVRRSRGHVKAIRVNPDAENLTTCRPDYYEKQIGQVEGVDRLAADGAGGAGGRRLAGVADVPARGSCLGEVLRPLPGAEVLVGLDFGRVYPAALFSQEINNRVNVQHEMLGERGRHDLRAEGQALPGTELPGLEGAVLGDPKGADKTQATSARR
jgi:hypothetical protein